MKYRLMLLQWMVLATAIAAPQPTKPPPSRPDGNRFLFILETSSGMTQLEHGGRQAIFDLIYSGVDGRMRRGDTFGVWTFNGGVHSGIVPMQTWDPRTRLEQAAALGRYLRTHKYDREGNFAELLKQLQAVIRGAKDVNIFVVTDGNTAFTGTPFDQVINAGFEANRTFVRETKKPVVVTLVARQAALTAACVTPGGTKIELAELPPVTNSVPETVDSGAQTNRTASAGDGSKKPAGQVIGLSDLEGQSTTANAATNKPPIDMSRALIITRPKVTNAVAAPVTSNAVAAVTNEPAKAAATASSVPPSTNEVRTSSAPEPLPAFVPGHVKASARAVQPPISIIVPPTGQRSTMPSLLLILGGAFLGASAVGAYLFMRKLRTRKEPSFISQGFERR